MAWSTAGLFTRLVDLDVWTILFWRGVFGACFVGIYVVALYRGQTIRIFTRLGFEGWGIVACEALGMIAYIPALKLTTVANVAVIYATVPLIAAGLAWAWIKETPSSRLLLLSLTGLSGVVIMVGGSTDLRGLSGDALAFAMTTGMAVTMVALRRYRDVPFPAVAFLANALGAILACNFAAVANLTATQLSILAAFGFVQMGLGLVLFGVGSRLAPAGEVALIGTLETPLAPLWVWLAVGEIPTVNTVLGGAIVMGSVILFLIGQGLQKKT